MSNATPVIANTETTQVIVRDAPDHEVGGGACHAYEITDKEGNQLAFIQFQHGPVKEIGVNGIRDADLLQILRHRLVAFQDGEYECEENAQILHHICAALNWEGRRTADRKKRGVEGTSEK